MQFVKIKSRQGFGKFFQKLKKKFAQPSFKESLQFCNESMVSNKPDFFNLGNYYLFKNLAGQDYVVILKNSQIQALYLIEDWESDYEYPMQEIFLMRLENSGFDKDKQEFYQKLYDIL